MIKFSCKNCGQNFNIEDKYSGKRVKCPKCGSVGIVPDNSDKITFKCENCGQIIRVSKSHAGKKGKCPKCNNMVIIPAREAIPAESAGPSASIPPNLDDNRYEEDSEEYEESEGMDRRLVLIISGAAAVVVVGLIILAVVFQSSGPPSIVEPEALRDPQEVVDRDLQPQPITSDSDQNETAEQLIDQEADVISTSQTSGYIDYIAELNELGIAGRLESDNAAPFYQKAGELYITGSPELMKLISTGWPADFSVGEQRLFREWVQSNSEALSQLELAAKKPYYWFQLSSSDGTVSAVRMPNLSDYRNLSRALMMRAKLSAAEGNSDEAIADIVTCYRFGLQIQTGGPKNLVQQLVGIAIRSMATRTAFDILDRTKLNKDLLQALQSQIEEFTTDESYIPDFRYEKFGLLDFIQRIFTDDGKGDGRIDLSKALPIISDTIAMSSSGTGLNSSDVESSLQVLRRRQTTETVEKSYQYIDMLVRKSPWQLKGENVDWTKMAEENILVKAFFPSERIAEIFARCRADTDGMITTLAVLRYQSDKGQLPEKLDELVTSGYLNILPSDPFSDETFTYKRTNERSFTLYSFGINLKDDEGKAGLSRSGQPNMWANNGDAVFWPVLR